MGSVKAVIAGLHPLLRHSVFCFACGAFAVGHPSLFVATISLLEIRGVGECKKWAMVIEKHEGFAYLPRRFK